MTNAARHVVLGLVVCGTLVACGGPNDGYGDPYGSGSGNLHGTGSGGRGGGYVDPCEEDPYSDDCIDQGGGGYGGGNYGGGSGGGSESGGGSSNCSAEGTWVDSEGGQHTETSAGSGASQDDAQYQAISNCNSLITLSVEQYNAAHLDSGGHAGSDQSCQVTGCY